ncbi:hypothetical protein [Pseudoduganella violacea]|uniref:Uncharacterized protein n=1 Tax=Pseudoduganella violacea TaxID=1715466 RepID=A0A7W5BF18_9BURK|nr:hypothetical protein [Pseudoduganella violacea]MBB3121992.1 hypothetical protein [Pseudoduganella violacea]
MAPDEALACALRQWMEIQSADTAEERGYQWKCLFLPAGSRLRMQYAGQWFYAEVRGDELLFEGQPVSPRGMTQMIAGDGRNAWRDLWVRLPGEKNWSRALLLRRDLLQREPPRPVSPLEAVNAAARSMSEALTASKALLDYVNRQSERLTERRISKHRRKDDTLGDDCRFD